MTTFYIAWTLHILEGVMQTSVLTIKILQRLPRCFPLIPQKTNEFQPCLQSQPGPVCVVFDRKQAAFTQWRFNTAAEQRGFCATSGRLAAVNLSVPHRSPCPEAGGRDRQVSRDRADLSKEWLPVKFNDRTGFGGEKTSQTIRPSQHSESHHKTYLISKTEEE